MNTKNHRGIPRLAALLVFTGVSLTLGQLSVISGSPPAYPQKADSCLFVSLAHSGRDSLSHPLPAAFFEELKANIDSVIHYVDAVKQHRTEVAGCPGTIKYRRFMVFFNEKKQVMKISFPCNGFGGGLLDIKKDKYPFVAVLKKGFSAKLDSLALMVKKNKR